MNSQTLQLILQTLTLIEVYSWILSVIGATLTSFWSEKDENHKEIQNSAFNHLLSIIGGSLIARFGTLSLMKWISFINENPPIGFLILGLLGNGVVLFVIKLGRRLGSDKSVNTIYELIKNLILSKFKK